MLVSKQKTQFKHCFMCAFKTWLQNRHIDFPVVNNTQFWAHLKDFIKDDGYIFNNDLGWTDASFIDQEIQYCTLYFEIYTDMEVLSSTETENIYNVLNSVITKQNSIAPPEELLLRMEHLSIWLPKLH